MNINYDEPIHFGIYARVLKRALDFIISFTALIILSPVFILLCILIKIKLGSPVFFRQIRAGKDEKPFSMIKFRTMTDARDNNGELLPDTERFTKFGDFLRNYSLDELPELINVLKGDMSIIGPRPLYTFYLPYYTEEEALRHTVRGGITGLAQINGRALCRWNDRFAYDVQYVKNITFTNDVKILFQTIAKVLNKSDIGVPSVTDEGGLHIVRDIQRPKLIKEIGSTFSENVGDRQSTKYPIEIANKKQEEHVIFLSTGRSCIREILKNIDDRKKCAIVPPFTCDSVIEPFIEAGYKVYPYHINLDFSLDLDALKNAINELRPSVLLFHRYFGFNTCIGIEELMESGLITIEDETHYMFSKNRSMSANFRFGSIRKWGPFPDGAYLVSKGLLLKQPVNEDVDFIKIETNAMNTKQAFLEGRSDDTGYNNLFAKGREYIDKQKNTFAMSSVSNYLVENSGSFIDKRRTNAALLIEGLQGFSWFTMPFTSLPEDITPFMIPILVHEDRIGFQKYLASQKIYATIIWGCPKWLKDKIGIEEKTIYDEILCIPCDQRYDTTDMQRIIFAIRRYGLKRETDE